MSESFWVKLTYKEYVGHYCEMTDAEIVADVRKSIGSFSNDRADGDDFGAKMVRKANARMNSEAAEASRANGQKGGRPKKLTAAASTSDGEDVLSDRESGCSARTNGCNTYDQETDQVSASSPAGAGVNLDSTQTISPDASDCKAEGVVTHGSTITRNVSRATRTSATSGQTIKRPDASSGNAEVVDSRGLYGSRASCTTATSGQTIEAPLRPGEGSTPEIERKSASLPSPTPIKTDPKPTRKAKAEVKPEEQKYPHGEFENIMLTTREYTQLCERLDNADSLIDEADGYFEAQPDKKRKYKSHYAMLLNWDRRRKEFEGVKPRKFKTAVDQDREEIKWLSDYYAKKERGENPPLPKIKMVGSV